jgi:hypothetical protein
MSKNAETDSTQLSEQDSIALPANFQFLSDDIEKIVDCYTVDTEPDYYKSISLSAVAAKEFLKRFNDILMLKKPDNAFAFERPDAPIIGIAIKHKEKDLTFYFFDKKIRYYIECKKGIGTSEIDTKMCTLDVCEELLNSL